MEKKPYFPFSLMQHISDVEQFIHSYNYNRIKHVMHKPAGKDKLLVYTVAVFTWVAYVLIPFDIMYKCSLWYSLIWVNK